MNFFSPQKMSLVLPPDLRRLVILCLPVETVQDITNVNDLTFYLTENEQILESFYNSYILPEFIDFPETLIDHEKYQAKQLILQYFNIFIGTVDSERFRAGLLLEPQSAFTKICANCGLVGHRAQLYIDAEIALIYAIRMKNEELVKYYLSFVDRDKVNALLYPIAVETLLAENKNIFAAIFAYLNTPIHLYYIHDIQNQEFADIVNKSGLIIVNHTDYSQYSHDDAFMGILSTFDLDAMKIYMTTRDFPHVNISLIFNRYFPENYFTRLTLLRVKELYAYIQNSFDDSTDKAQYLLLLEVLLNHDIDAGVLSEIKKDNLDLFKLISTFASIVSNVKVLRKISLEEQVVFPTIPSLILYGKSPVLSMIDQILPLRLNNLGPMIDLYWNTILYSAKEYKMSYCQYTSQYDKDVDKQYIEEAALYLYVISKNIFTTDPELAAGIDILATSITIRPNNYQTYKAALAVVANSENMILYITPATIKQYKDEYDDFVARYNKILGK